MHLHEGKGEMVLVFGILAFVSLAGSQMAFMPRYPFFQLPSSQKVISDTNGYKEGLLQSRITIEVKPSTSNVKTVVSPPLCIACRCLQGYTSCTEAGGRQFVTQSCYTGALGNVYSAGAECSYPASSTLSVCESTCKKSCPAPSDDTAPTLSDCIDLPTSFKRHCNSQCARLPEGTVVSCSPAKPGVVSSLPPSCSTSRGKRATNISVPEESSRNVDTAHPDIESSLQLSPGRKDRKVEFFLFPTVAGILPTKTISQVSVYKGAFTATYVASDGACLEADAVDAPFC